MGEWASSLCSNASHITYWSELFDVAHALLWSRLTVFIQAEFEEGRLI